MCVRVCVREKRERGAKWGKFKCAIYAYVCDKQTENTHGWGARGPLNCLRDYPNM